MGNFGTQLEEEAAGGGQLNPSFSVCVTTLPSVSLSFLSCETGWGAWPCLLLAQLSLEIPMRRSTYGGSWDGGRSSDLIAVRKLTREKGRWELSCAVPTWPTLGKVAHPPGSTCHGLRTVADMSSKQEEGQRE
jgi:hypothetical protein